MKRPLAFIAFALVLTGCGSDGTDVGNAPDVMPDDFSDLVTTCIGSVRVFVSTDDVRSSSGVTAVLDPEGCAS
jgi:uncharacterized lipoprotein YajG